MSPPHEELVERFFELQTSGTLDLADDAILDVLDGLRVQVGVIERWKSAGDRIGGWKIAFSSGPGRAAMEDGFRPFGYVLERRILPSGATLDRAEIGNTILEPELCVTLDAPLRGPSVSVDQARAAVSAVAPAFEINAHRLPGRPLPFIVADDLAQWGVVVGEERPVSEVDVLATKVGVTHDGVHVAEQVADGHLDDPFVSLASVCAALDQFDLGIEAGQRVITGAFSVHSDPGAGEWRADFDGIGAVEVELR